MAEAPSPAHQQGFSGAEDRDRGQSDLQTAAGKRSTPRAELPEPAALLFNLRQANKVVAGPTRRAVARRRGVDAQLCITQPPSILIVCPVMFLAKSEAR